MAKSGFSLLMNKLQRGLTGTQDFLKIRVPWNFCVNSSLISRHSGTLSFLLLYIPQAEENARGGKFCIE